jgi:hypothetical protein
MSNKAVLDTKIGGDNVEFNRSIEQAEKRAESFTGKVESLFRRTGSIRAERSIDVFAQRLAQGDIVGGLESIASRMTGLGFGAAVAFGAGSAVLTKFAADITASEEATKSLGKELSILQRTPAGLSEELITKGIGNLNHQIDDAIKKSKGIGNSFAQTIRSLEGDSESGPKFQALEKIAESIRERRRQLQLAADAEEDTVNIRRIGVEVSANQARLLESQLKTSQKIAEIDDARNRFAKNLSQLLPSGARRELIQNNNEFAERMKAAAAQSGQVDIEEMSKKFEERFKLTIDELAKVAEPRNVLGSPYFNRSDEEFTVEGNQNAISPQALFNARQARRVKSLRDQADDLIRNQADFEGATRLRKEASDILNAKGDFKVTTVKDSEKGADIEAAMRNALTSTAVPVLNEIREAIGKISFANQ